MSLMIVLLIDPQPADDGHVKLDIKTNWSTELTPHDVVAALISTADSIAETYNLDEAARQQIIDKIMSEPA